MENVVELNSGRNRGQISEVMVDLEAMVGSVFVHAFATTLKSSDEALQMRAERERNTTLQQRYFDDLHAFRRTQSLANMRFRAACAMMFNCFVENAETVDPAAAVEPELTMVGDDELELDLALFRIGKRCDEAAPKLRHQVQRRFQVLLGLAEGAAAPLCGVSLARLCRVGISVLELDIQARLFVLKHLERDFAAVCERALDSANSILIDHGVLPNLRAMPVKTTTAGNQREASQSSPSPARALNGVATAPLATNPGMAPVAQRVALHSVGLAVHARASSPSATAVAIATPAPCETASLDDARERRRLEIAERRNAEIGRARELRVTAERVADASIASVITQPHMPTNLSVVLQGPLRRYLEAVYTRRGDGSAEWRSAKKLVGDIAWSFDPETLRCEHAHWRAMVPDIVTSLRGALASVGLDDRTVNAVVGGFRDRYEALLKPALKSASTTDSNVATLTVPVEPIAVTDAEPASVETVATPVAPSFAEALERVRQFVLGQWFELMDERNVMQRAKLVWTSARTERCMFVNSNGKLVADRPHNRVAADIIAGQLREVAEPALAVATH